MGEDTDDGAEKPKRRFGRRKKDYSPWVYRKIGAKTTDTIAMSLSRIFRAGPAVSLNGSPTVSPVTAAI